MNELDWRSYHLFYHGDRDAVLCDFVRPVLGELWRDRRIDSFFFIRYSLGGPHLRLRVLPSPGCASVVADVLERTAAAYLAARPSTSPRSEEQIRRESRAILANDPHEQDDTIYPDNSFLPVSVRFETERYGGPELLPSSLDFFALSSVEALHFLMAHRGKPAGRRLSLTFRLLARQALGLAGNVAELFDLFDHAVQLWPPLSAIAARANQVYEQRSETFRQLLRAETGPLLARPVVESPPPGCPAWGVECSRRLAWEIAPTPPGVRLRIGSSQMHMTANRLGLLNTDEVYLGRLLGRAARDLAASGHLDDFPDRCPDAAHDPGSSLHDLLGAAFAELFQAREGSRTSWDAEARAPSAPIDGGAQTC